MRSVSSLFSIHTRALWCGCSLALAACAKDASLSIGSKAVQPKTVEVTRGPMQRTLLLYGRLEALTSEELLAPRTEMWTVNIRHLIEDGSKVNAGDVVVEFDNSAFVRRLSENTLSLEAAEAELIRQQAVIDTSLAEKDIAATRAEIGLRKAELEAAVPEDAFPRRIYQEKQLALERAQASSVKAREDRASAVRAGALDLKVRQIAIEKSQKDLEETQRGLLAMTLRAPRAGLVLISDHPRERRNYQAGDTAHPGSTIASIPDLSGYRFVAQMSDVDDGQVQVGMRAQCFVDAYPDTALDGRVVAVSPVARRPSRDSSRSYFMVTVALPLSTPQLRPGMSARAEVLTRETASALRLPRVALSGKTGDFWVKDLAGTVHKIGIDFCSADACSITGPLALGTRLREAP